MEEFRKKLSEDFPLLQATMSPEFLHIWKPKSSHEGGLNFLPDFHLICQEASDILLLKLMTFHGKNVKDFNFALNEFPDEIKELLSDYSLGKIQICAGISREKAAPAQDYLTEFFNDSIIVRSLNCKFVLTNELLCCEECNKILPFIKLEPMVSITKIEDIPFEINHAEEFSDEEEIEEEEEDEEWQLPLKIEKEEIKSEGEFVDISHQRTSAVWRHFYCDQKNERAKCNMCQTILKCKYGSTKSMIEHLKRIHPDQSSTEDQNYKDEDFVDISEERKSLVWTHFLLDKENDRAKCKTCSVVLKCKYSSTKSLIEHMKKIHKQKIKVSVERIPSKIRKSGGGRPTDAESGKERFSAKCKVCLRVYKSKCSYEDDQAKHAKFFDLTGSMKCPECKEMVEKLKMTAHFDLHHAGQTCCIGCQKTMENIDGALRKHVVKFHHKQTICETCGKVFNDPRLFDVHVKSAHSDVRDHFCDRCGKAFAHRLLLEKHLNHACSDEEWVCPICSKMFSCKEKLRFHLATHCDYKPYVCRYCPYSSNKCDNICIHVKKVHKLRGFRDDTTVLEDVLELQRKFIAEHLARVNKSKLRKPYQRSDTGAPHPYSKAMQVPQVCHLCGKTYASGDSIRRHLDLHSGKKPYKCRLCGYSALKASIITVRHFNNFHAEEGISEYDILAVDETELEEMREFSTREFLNLTPASATTSAKPE